MKKTKDVFGFFMYFMFLCLPVKKAFLFR